MGLQSGTRFGGYQIISMIGAGGMGEVYRARDERLGREVALKILPPAFTADSERRARFAREARLLAALNLPNIATIYGLEESEGITALVLELLEGSSLADRLTRGPLKSSEAVAIARQVARALEVAHAKGIVHRDLKPGNIVLQGGAGGVPHVKVLDFGVAKPFVVAGLETATETQPAHPDVTADGRIVGTPAYMSPEQARGLPVDKRTDIWAFACVLFEMLTGRRPFSGPTLSDTVSQILEHDPDWAVAARDAARGSHADSAVSAEGSGEPTARCRRCAY